jgi:hypothetical protein
LHPKIAERIASNLAAVKRKGGQKEASKWWTERFSNMGKDDYEQVVNALRKRNGLPTAG